LAPVGKDEPLSFAEEADLRRANYDLLNHFFVPLREVMTKAINKPSLWSFSTFKELEDRIPNPFCFA